ncbi:MAG: EamA family transporter, partial [Sulfurimonas sp.]
LAYLTHGEIVFTNFVENLDDKALFSIFFQVYPTTLFGYWVWNSLIHKYPVSSIAPISLLIPIFGLLGSYFIFNENIGYIS